MYDLHVDILRLHDEEIAGHDDVIDAKLARKSELKTEIDAAQLIYDT